MRVGDILESYLPQRTRAIVFAITGDIITVVTDFGNISNLTRSEVLSIYAYTGESQSPDVWVQDKVNLLKKLFEMFPQLLEVVDL